MVEKASSNDEPEPKENCDRKPLYVSSVWSLSQGHVGFAASFARFRPVPRGLRPVVFDPPTRPPTPNRPPGGRTEPTTAGGRTAPDCPGLPSTAPDRTAAGRSTLALLFTALSAAESSPVSPIPTKTCQLSESSKGSKPCVRAWVEANECRRAWVELGGRSECV